MIETTTIQSLRTKSATGRLGFTLIELMVVVAIIGILSTIAAATYKRFIKRARISEAITHLHDIKAKQEAYHGRFDRYASVCGVGADEKSQLNGTCAEYFYPAATKMGTKHAWDPGAAGFWNGFAAIGFDKKERLYFQYGTVSDGRDPGNISAPGFFGTPAGTEWFCVAARAKFDNDIDNDVYVEITSHTDTAWRIGLGENTTDVIPNSPCGATGEPGSGQKPSSGGGQGPLAAASSASATQNTGSRLGNTAAQTGNALANTALGNTVQAIAVQPNTVQAITAVRNTVQRNTTLWNTAQRSTAQQNTTQRSTAQRSTAQQSNNMMQQTINLVR